MQVKSKTQWECICTCDGILEKMGKLENAKKKLVKVESKMETMKAKKKNEDRKGEKWNKDYQRGKKKGDGKQKQ